MNLSTIYSNGLAEERRVIDLLRTIFPNRPVKPATQDENLFADIDCHWGTERISIKAQHSGASYGNIYLELLQRPKEVCTEAPTPLNMAVIDSLAASGWVHSWYYTSQADTYAILQGDLLRLYDKAALTAYVQQHGFLRIKPLSYPRRQYLLDANYRYNDAICGFLPIAAVPSIELSLPAYTPAPPARRSAPVLAPRALVAL